MQDYHPEQALAWALTNLESTDCVQPSSCEKTGIDRTTVLTESDILEAGERRLTHNLCMVHGITL